MRVLVITPQFYPSNSGYANAVTNFTNALRKQGKTDVSIIVLDRLDPRTGAAGYPEAVYFDDFIWFPEKHIGYILRQLALARRLKRHLAAGDEYDLILIETAESPFVTWWSIGRKKLLTRKTILRIHATQETEHFLDLDTWYFRINRYFAKRLIEAIPNIASTSKHYIEFVKRRYLSDNVVKSFKNYAVIPNIAEAADTEGALPAPRGTEIRIFMLGRMNRLGYVQKNFELFAHAMFLLGRKWPEIYQRYKIVVVGDGELASDFKTLLTNLGLDDTFSLVARMSHDSVRELQKSSDFVAVVSRYEGMSMFALEALFQGAPLIVGRGTALESLVTHGENGFLVDPDDPNELCSILAKVPDCDREAMRAASLARAKEYSSDRVVSNFLDFATIARNSLK